MYSRLPGFFISLPNLLAVTEQDQLDVGVDLFIGQTFLDQGADYLAVLPHKRQFGGMRIRFAFAYIIT